MLSRVLEPEVMDSAAEAHDYDAMDHSTVNRVFVADLLAVWNGRGPVLDVGAGTAQIPIELCRRHPSAEVTAIDLAEHMLALARQNVQSAGLAARIRPEKQNARTMTYAAGSFQAVISNSIVHHIPEPAAVFAEMVRVCAPGGLLFVRDLMRPSDLPTLNRLVDTYAAGANNHQRKMFSESLHAALTLDEVRHIVAAFGFDPATVQATSDRHWTWTTHKPVAANQA
jgi:ubiquinone/menaquinone biosynthesis C-methylase UbiE